MTRLTPEPAHGPAATSAYRERPAADAKRNPRREKIAISGTTDTTATSQPSAAPWTPPSESAIPGSPRRPEPMTMLTASAIPRGTVISR